MSQRRDIDRIAAMARAKRRQFRAEVIEHGAAIALNALALAVCDLPDEQRRVFADSLATFDRARAAGRQLADRIAEGGP